LNLRPKDSLCPPFPAEVDYLFTRRVVRVGCGTLVPVIKSTSALR
jgi:hypothetical protein